MRHRLWLPFALVLLLALTALAPSCGGDDGDDDDSGDDDDDSGPSGDLDGADSWLYQLQELDPEAVGSSNFDVVVSDYSETGEADGEFSTADVAEMKRGGRVALCYVSIGEAENYRWYWNDDWETDPPDWLDDPNPNWPNNYKVRYWDPDWQQIVFDWLDVVVGQGFDGAYLDIIDGYEYWWDKGVEDADERMIEFVRAIRSHTRSQNSDFLIFPQNGSDLVWEADYIDLIDGIGAEDTWFEEDDPIDDAEDIRYKLENLDYVVEEGKTVLAVDYVREADHIAEFYAKARARGYIPYATVKDLDRMVVNEGYEP